MSFICGLHDIPNENYVTVKSSVDNKSRELRVNDYNEKFNKLPPKKKYELHMLKFDDCLKYLSNCEKKIEYIIKVELYYGLYIRSILFEKENVRILKINQHVEENMKRHYTTWKEVNYNKIKKRFKLSLFKEDESGKNSFDLFKELNSPHEEKRIIKKKKFADLISPKKEERIFVEKKNDYIDLISPKKEERIFIEKKNDYIDLVSPKKEERIFIEKKNDYIDLVSPKKEDKKERIIEKKKDHVDLISPKKEENDFNFYKGSFDDGVDGTAFTDFDSFTPDGPFGDGLDADFTDLGSFADRDSYEDFGSFNISDFSSFGFNYNSSVEKNQVKKKYGEKKLVKKKYGGTKNSLESFLSDKKWIKTTRYRLFPKGDSVFYMESNETISQPLRHDKGLIVKTNWCLGRWSGSQTVTKFKLKNDDFQVDEVLTMEKIGRNCLGVYRCPLFDCKHTERVPDSRNRNKKKIIPPCPIHLKGLIYQECKAKLFFLSSADERSWLITFGKHDHPKPPATKKDIGLAKELQKGFENNKELKPNQAVRGIGVSLVPFLTIPGGNNINYAQSQKAKANKLAPSYNKSIFDVLEVIKKLNEKLKKDCEVAIHEEKYKMNMKLVEIMESYIDKDFMHLTKTPGELSYISCQTSLQAEVENKCSMIYGDAYFKVSKDLYCTNFVCYSAALNSFVIIHRLYHSFYDHKSFKKGMEVWKDRKKGFSIKYSVYGHSFGIDYHGGEDKGLRLFLIETAMKEEGLNEDMAIKLAEELMYGCWKHFSAAVVEITNTLFGKTDDSDEKVKFKRLAFRLTSCNGSKEADTIFDELETTFEKNEKNKKNFKYWKRGWNTRLRRKMVSNTEHVLPLLDGLHTTNAVEIQNKEYFSSRSNGSNIKGISGNFGFDVKTNNDLLSAEHFQVKLAYKSFDEKDRYISHRKNSFFKHFKNPSTVSGRKKNEPEISSSKSGKGKGKKSRNRTNSKGKVNRTKRSKKNEHCSSLEYHNFLESENCELGLMVTNTRAEKIDGKRKVYHCVCGLRLSCSKGVCRCKFCQRLFFWSCGVMYFGYCGADYDYISISSRDFDTSVSDLKTKDLKRKDLNFALCRSCLCEEKCGVCKKKLDNMSEICICANCDDIVHKSSCGGLVNHKYPFCSICISTDCSTCQNCHLSFLKWQLGEGDLGNCCYACLNLSKCSVCRIILPKTSLKVKNEVLCCDGCSGKILEEPTGIVTCFICSGKYNVKETVFMGFNSSNCCSDCFKKRY